MPASGRFIPVGTGRMAFLGNNGRARCVLDSDGRTSYTRR